MFVCLSPDRGGGVGININSVRGGGREGALWQSSDLVTRYDWIQDPETVLTPIE